MHLPFNLYPGITAQHALSLQTEGRISDRDRQMARDHDARHPLKAPARVNIVNVRPSRDVALTLLCDAMYRAITMNGCVTQYDLERTALPALQIAELAPVAMQQLAGALEELTSVATAGLCLEDRHAHLMGAGA